MVRSSGVWTDDRPAGHRTGATAWKANASGATRSREAQQKQQEEQRKQREEQREQREEQQKIDDDYRPSQRPRPKISARRATSLRIYLDGFGRVKGTFGTAEQPIYLHAPHLVVQADRGVSEMFVRFVKLDGKSPSPDFSLDEEDQTFPTGYLRVWAVGGVIRMEVWDCRPKAQEHALVAKVHVIPYAPWTVVLDEDGPVDPWFRGKLQRRARALQSGCGLHAQEARDRHPTPRHERRG